jgi:hypothetical protein
MELHLFGIPTAFATALGLAVALSTQPRKKRLELRGVIRLFSPQVKILHPLSRRMNVRGHHSTSYKRQGAASSFAASAVRSSAASA